MAFTLCTSGAATNKAGANCSSTILADETALNEFSDQTERKIEVETKTSWVSNYGSLTSGAQTILADAASSDIAKKMIAYDMSGYTSRQEAGLMLDLNDDIYNKCIKALSQASPNDLKTP